MIYLNLANDYVTIKTYTFNVGTEIIFYDLFGREFSRQKLTRVKTLIDIKQFNRGIYLIQFVDQIDSITSKLIVY
jgi:hypothetical protein